MRLLARVCFTLVQAALFGAVSALAGQVSGQTSPPAPTPACALLSVAEIRSITGRGDYPGYVDGDAEGEGAGGGSSCQYGGMGMMPDSQPPLLSVVLIKGKHWTERTRTSSLPAGCQREPVAGVGDAAFFESCPSRLQRTAPLYVQVGNSDLIVQMDVEAPATPASVRPLVIAVAKAAVLKLR